MYQTNQQAWDQVTNAIIEANRRTEILQQLFGQDNLKGLWQTHSGLLDQLFAGFALHRCEGERCFGIAPDNEVHSAVAEITDTVEYYKGIMLSLIPLYSTAAYGRNNAFNSEAESMTSEWRKRSR